MKYRCPFCPKEYQSRKDLHNHLKKIHNADMDDDTLDNLEKELLIGDMYNWNEDKLTKKK